MSEQKKSIELRMLNNSFSVVADGNEDYICEISSFVNQELNAILEKNPHTNHIRIAILGCMNIAEMLFNTKKEIADAELARYEEIKRVEAVSKKLKSAQSEINGLKDTIAAMKREKETQQNEIDEKMETMNRLTDRLKQAKNETEGNRESILNLQNQLFECQIELKKAQEGH